MQTQIEDLNTEAVDEMKAKISDTKKVLRGYERQIEELTAKATGTSKIRRSQRSRISDEQLQPQLLAAMAKHGKEGLNLLNIVI